MEVQQKQGLEQQLANCRQSYETCWESHIAHKTCGSTKEGDAVREALCDLLEQVYSTACQGEDRPSPNNVLM